MGQKTPLYHCHLNSHAKIVDFSGWDMPLHYGSQVEEHHSVRKNAGLFDVSHMLAVDISGQEAKSFLQYALANDVGRLTQPGKALYTCMLNENGGVIDDLIVYFFNPQHYRIVINAGRRDVDLAWLTQLATAYKVQLTPRYDLAMLALQGPNAKNYLQHLLSSADLQKIIALSSFQGIALNNDVFIARTGYTGEEGYEMILPPTLAVDWWTRLINAGVAPCGLGARDTLRLEAGLNLYGSDMTEHTSPLETNLTWTVSFSDRDFVGKRALEQQKQHGLTQKLVGLLLQDRGVLRNHQKIIVEGIGEGEITSGSFSPTLGFSIALARVPINTPEKCQVEIRGKLLDVQVVKPPFVKKQREEKS